MKALERDLPFAASARGERKDGSGLPDLHHIGMVVADLDRALAELPKSLGLGPAHIIDGNMSTARVTSSGVVGFRLRIGLVWLGNLLLELLQPMDDRSPLAEYLKVHGEGMHHFGYLVRSIEHELDAMAAASDDGQRPALLAEAPSNDGHGISFCYIDGKNRHGAVIELVQRTPEALDFKLHLNDPALDLSDDNFAVSQGESDFLLRLYSGRPLDRGYLPNIRRATCNPCLNPDDKFHGAPSLKFQSTAASYCDSGDLTPHA